jgi:ATP-dependent exoDNAse (exonuclease V) beta subunit
VPTELREHEDEVLRRDREEGERLAYVAVTRARDLLVVPVVGDEERRSWLEALAPVVHPLPARKRAPEAAPGCPPFGTDSVVSRARDCERMPTDSVAPGQHLPRAGAHRIVWWDPNTLALGLEVGGGIRQRQILEADASKEVATAGAVAHAEWQQRRTNALARGAAPSLAVRSVTEAARTATPSGPPVALESTGLARGSRPGGKRFGSLVHAILAAVELGGDAAHVRAIAINQARLLAAPPDEVEAAVTSVCAALAHPLLVRARVAADVRREVPIAMKTPDDLVEGVIDLAFAEPAGWTVVDFKTDAELAQFRARYEAQVRLYARALTAATGRPATAVLLVV